jgi:hypothetical protein
MNWELFKPRNLIVVAVIAVIAIFAYNYFHNKIGGANAPSQAPAGGQ